jgi:hypothetical protein
MLKPGHFGSLQAVAAAAGDEVDEFNKETAVTQDDILNQELAIRGCSPVRCLCRFCAMPLTWMLSFCITASSPVRLAVLGS